MHTQINQWPPATTGSYGGASFATVAPTVSGITGQISRMADCNKGLIEQVNRARQTADAYFGPMKETDSSSGSSNPPSTSQLDQLTAEISMTQNLIGALAVQLDRLACI